MSHHLSLVLVVPAALQAKANLLACGLGHDELPGSTYAVPLAPSEDGPVSHFGCHTWAQPAFVHLLAAAAQGSLPPVPWRDFGLTQADVADVVAGLISRATDGAAGENFQAVLDGAGLVRVPLPEE